MTGTVTQENSKTLKFVPSGSLTGSIEYTVNIRTCPTDLSSKSLAGVFSEAFANTEKDDFIFEKPGPTEHKESRNGNNILFQRRNYEYEGGKKMISIKSFLTIPTKKIINLDKISKKSHRYFIEITDKQKILKFKRKYDLDNIEGAIIIDFQNKNIMNFRHWDSIELFWTNFLKMIKVFNDSEDGYAETYFPAQPVTIKCIAHDKGLIQFHLGDSKWILPKEMFFSKLLEASELFFNSLIAYFPENKDWYQRELKKIEDLKLIPVVARQL
ncbi:MAG: hypothetical protein GY757_31930 [bacterium]|nr:hypothetical protein [bacterium]